MPEQVPVSSFPSDTPHSIPVCRARCPAVGSNEPGPFGKGRNTGDPTGVPPIYIKWLLPRLISPCGYVRLHGRETDSDSGKVSAVLHGFLKYADRQSPFRRYTLHICWLCHVLASPPDIDRIYRKFEGAVKGIGTFCKPSVNTAGTRKAPGSKQEPGAGFSNRSCL